MIGKPNVVACLTLLTASLKCSWSKACLAFGIKLHWIRQESGAAVMEWESMSLHRARCLTLLWPVISADSAVGAPRRSTDASSRGRMQLCGCIHVWLCEPCGRGVRDYYSAASVPFSHQVNQRQTACLIKPIIIFSKVSGASDMKRGLTCRYINLSSIKALETYKSNF